MKVVKLVEIVRSDTYRIRISIDQYRKLPLKGATIRLKRDVWNHPNEFLCQIETNDTNPYNTNKEKFKEDIDKILENIDVRQDHLREAKYGNIFSKQPLEWLTDSSNKNVKRISKYKDEKYDKLLNYIDKTINLSKIGVKTQYV